MVYNAESIKFKIARLKKSDDIIVLVEETTDVIYLKLSEGYSMGGLTPMLDPETGLPLTYKVWEAKYKNKNK